MVEGKAMVMIKNLCENPHCSFHCYVERVEEFGITMCGFAPAAIMIVAAKKLGAKNARLVKYQTSGDVSGDASSVVGYAGIIVN